MPYWSNISNKTNNDTTYDFELTAHSEIGQVLLGKGIGTFQQAGEWIAGLPYRRNTDKDKTTIVLEENCGTCSTKHALLKRLADQHGRDEVRLMLGIYRMDGQNTPGIGPVLHQHRLSYLPEAHNYLRVHGHILDFTGLEAGGAGFEQSLLREVEIRPEQITDFKVRFHQETLAEWLEKEALPFSLAEIWRIREACIAAIG